MNNVKVPLCSSISSTTLALQMTLDNVFPKSRFSRSCPVFYQTYFNSAALSCAPETRRNICNHTTASQIIPLIQIDRDEVGKGRGDPFISSQRQGCELRCGVHKDIRLMVVLSCSYSRAHSKIS